MKGKTEVVEALQKALAEELQAINQYFLHSEMQNNWGYKRLHAEISGESTGGWQIVRRPDDRDQRLWIIKAVRELTLLGLADAKAAVERCDRDHPVNLGVHPETVRSLQELRDLGCTIARRS